MSSTVLITNDQGVRVISLNRPGRLNAINGRLVADLDAALAAAEADTSVKVILLRGEGRAFCVGDDLHEQIEIATGEPHILAAQVDALQGITKRLMLGRKPVIGQIHGWAIGAGFSWALNCDMAVWAEGTRAFLPELSFGLFVTGGVSFLLPKLVGLTMARECILLGRRIDAEELKQKGAALRVVPLSRLHDEALAVAHQVAALPASALHNMRQALLGADRGALISALQSEKQACLATVRDAETVARMRQFMAQKRASAC